jgi:hypothetical protein
MWKLLQILQFLHLTIESEPLERGMPWLQLLLAQCPVTMKADSTGLRK